MDYKPPDYLSLQGNIAENWRQWKNRFQTFLTAKECDGKPEKVKKAILLTCIGPDAHQRYETFQLDAEATLATVLTTFENHFKGEKRLVFHRFQFWSHPRGEGEPCMEFINKIKLMAKDCEFTEEENMIRDKIVFTVKEKSLKERLLREAALTLAKTEEMCRAFEVTQEEMKRMTSGPADKSVHAVRHKPPERQFSSKGASLGARQGHSQDHNQARRDQCPDQGPSKLPKWKCKRCGTKHQRGQCPAYGKTCSKCQNINHFASECRSRSRRVHEVAANEDEYWIGTIMKCLTVASVPRKNRGWFVCVSVGPGGSKVKMKVDTGAETNTIPLRTWSKIKDAPEVRSSSTVLQAYGDSKVEHTGSAMTSLQVGDATITTEVFVTTGKTVPILGLEASRQLGLVQPGPNGSLLHAVTQHSTEPLTLESMKEEYAELFQGLGVFPGEYKIQLKEDAEPVVHHARRIATALYQPLKEKLLDMESRGVVEPVDGPTDWVNSLVITEKKDGSLRFCLDPKDLNKAIKREQFQIPTFEEIVTRLGGKKVFSILDLRDSYWQVKLDEESSRLCTFNTPFGRYRFKRMPFGIKSASEILQKKTYTTYGDIDGVFVISDDMLIAGTDDADHDRIIRAVLDRAREYGNRFNPKKVQYKLPQVHYMGRIVGQDGVKPDDVKIKAIQDMPDPTDKDGVRRLLGMLNFLAPFIPDMSTITAPIRSLMKQDVPWQWMPEHSQAVTRLKDILSAKPVLRLYDPSKPVAIQADASSTGLGACLLQESQPIAYASRALTDPETRYAQIEREMLAIVFAAEQFHQYIYGTEVEVMSDHKPLESIVLKPLRDASPRLQLMRLRLLRYKLTVRYVPGSKMYIADTLSRAHGASIATEDTQEDFRVHSVTASLPATPQRIKEIQDATQSDETLIKLKDYAQNGWPTHKSACSPNVKPYWGLRDSIYEDDGLMFVGEKLIVPTSLRSDMLSKLHAGHMGMEKSKARARECLYWPHLSEDIEDIVGRCSTCAMFRKQNQQEPLMPHPVPGRPWAKVGADIFDFRGKDYLVVVDYFSKYPEVVQLHGKTADEVVRVLKPIFARHGIPDVLMSDNMPFQSHVIKQFANEWGFDLITSSPTYAQSNGQSERYVGIVKSMLRKAAQEGKDPNLALLEYRTTPLSGMEYSPAQLLMSRRLKSVIPVTSSLLQPAVALNTQDKLAQRQDKQKLRYDQRARHHWHSAPNIGDNVRVRLGKTWDPAVIVDKHPAPRSYYVTTEDGQTYRRNQRFINTNRDKVWVMPPDTGVPLDTTANPSNLTSANPQDEPPHPQSPPRTPAHGSRSRTSLGPQMSETPGRRIPSQPESSRRGDRCRTKPQWHKDYVVN